MRAGGGKCLSATRQESQSKAERSGTGWLLMFSSVGMVDWWSPENVTDNCPVIM